MSPTTRSKAKQDEEKKEERDHSKSDAKSNQATAQPSDKSVKVESKQKRSHDTVECETEVKSGSTNAKDGEQTSEIRGNTQRAPEKESQDEPANKKAKTESKKNATEGSGPQSEKRKDGASAAGGEIKVMKELVAHDDVREFGRIHFLFKPKVEVEDPKSMDDVQSFHVILQPHAKSRPEGQEVLSRLIRIGRKTLPGGDAGPGNKRPFWAFVATVAENASDLHERIEESTKETKTRGTRTTGADRIIASGPYCILSQPANASGSNPDRRTTTLVYSITLPKEPGEVQKAFGIEAEGSFVLSVKNPNASDPPAAGLKEKAKYPKELQEKIGELRFAPIEPPTYLDHPNAELLFIRAHHKSDLERTAGDEIAEELREVADEEHVKEAKSHKIEQEVEREIFAMLDAQDKEHVLTGEEALIKGTWE